ncbi:uncharacterized protein LOC126984869 isoform X8 [Eriocheir sinensis]|uniref:uncharacterized protein LOC126984869 isoform X4 n=1 Tax=Eriocheir sinensis TaxID=95602 RepID=UPI0021C644CB|nr:uncharacterized protein LOC126984869 isoform X4 [Eriocheir sinensis]XP_050695116.1 uncharacterized protein LOC126984869 isoform X5 [Eriocheir sinensis]XP_050695117.1 uncharacterized protein LOC126984869 isoform X6 [Eriocheir sinensis]XP_050695119.1 uncharacterized protein LOC126984869 isoform X7 [Eriocheir sinensis]XP_050695120.1 uncharacterized protein LOC126984869 isoform X8 [Eriocheir sinensis]
MNKDKQDPDGDIIMRLEYGLLNSSSLELIERVKQFANLVLALMMLFARYNHWMVGDKFERLAPSLPRSHPPQPPKGRTEEQPPTPSLAAPHLLSSPPPPPPPLSTWTVEKGCLVWRCLIGSSHGHVHPRPRPRTLGLRCVEEKRTRKERGQQQHTQPPQRLGPPHLQGWTAA